MTFVYIPVDADEALVSALQVDICVLYAPPKTMSQIWHERALSLCRNLSRKGMRIFLVVGGNVDSPEPGQTYQDISDSIRYFYECLNGIILGDDVVSKANLSTLNTVARWIGGNWSGLKMGLGLDPPPRNESPQPAYYDRLGQVDLALYDFICTYHYSLVDIAHHYYPQMERNRVPNLIVGDGTDPVETDRLEQWIEKVKEISVENRIAVWFMLAGFSNSNLIATPSQMCIDLWATKEAGFEAIGWFTMSRTEGGDIVFVGDPNKPRLYDWYIYYCLKTVLVDLARQLASSRISEGFQEILDALQILVLNMAELRSELAGWGGDLSQLVDNTAFGLRRALADAKETWGRALDNLTRDLERVREDRAAMLSRLDNLTLSTGSALEGLTDDMVQLKTGQATALSLLQNLTGTTAQLEQREASMLATAYRLTDGVDQIRQNMTSMLATLEGLARSVARLDTAQKRQTWILTAFGAVLVALAVAGCVLSWRLARRGK